MQASLENPNKLIIIESGFELCSTHEALCISGFERLSLAQVSLISSRYGAAAGARECHG